MLFKTIEPLLYRVTVTCLMVGVILLWFSRWQKAGKIVVTVGTALYLLFVIWWLTLS